MSRRGSWSGKTWAFVFFMVFMLLLTLFPALYPVIFRAGVDTVLLLLLHSYLWLISGWSGVITIWGFAIAICFMVIGGAVMAVQSVYRWIRSDGGNGSDSGGDKYRVDKELR